MKDCLPGPKIHELRITYAREFAAITARSPASLVRPYSLIGRGSSSMV